ncbi:heavy-metal-associated domain-containing protein [Flavobacterium sp. MK4S-17]|jgi:copper chaperone CopZ|uniref:heavy-metal-associated domain-containing protein n=1 Tax=Flavobacterium sp. MK4S-17 TaxID=2543737 RepID=UPI00135C3203|nr:heavy-metal-associated domain-containing protein [Flavobacterium sp. MK4S-17]
MKKFVLVLLVMLTGIAVQAQEKKSKNAKYDIEVKGNCDLCKKRIEKAAYSVKGVKSAAWHEDHQDLHLIIDENKCSIDDVHKAVAKTGHDTNKIKAADGDYANLHHCCQYERNE